ncbi:unnamed protein product [Cunninghamella blakesleeana]
MEVHNNTNLNYIKTLIIDNYDSYTFNLLQFFDPDQVVVIRNYQYNWQEFSENILPHFDNILISPGPGRPERSTDFGICTPLIEAQMDPQQCKHHRPIFGVCLGHQGIGHLFGGSVIYAPRIMHGRMSEIHSSHTDSLFYGSIFNHCTTPFWAVRYHSLVVDPASLPNCLEITAYCEENDADIEALKNSTYLSDENSNLSENQRFHYLDHQPNPLSSSSSNTNQNKSITVMAFQHKNLPLWGVQFHPESVSTEHGQSMINNFTLETYNWMLKTGRPLDNNKLNNTIQSISVAIPKSMKTDLNLEVNINQTSLSTSSYELYIKPCFPTWVSPEYMVEELLNGNVVDGLNVSSVSWLDSSRKSSPYSQVSILSVDPSLIIRYSTLHKQINIQDIQQQQQSTLFLDQNDNFFDYISKFTEQFGKIQVHPCYGSNIQRQHDEDDEAQNDFISSRLSFKGGLTGYFGYEMKRESMDGYITPNEQQCSCLHHDTQQQQHLLNNNNSAACCDCMVEPDAAFHFVDKFWIFDHQQQKMYVCCLVNQQQQNDYNIGFNNEKEAFTWMTIAEKMILHTVEAIRRRQITNDFDSLTPASSTCTTPIPKSNLLDQQAPIGSDLFTANVQHDAYLKSIEECIRQIKEGESYEICLTTRFRLSLPNDDLDDDLTDKEQQQEMKMHHIWQLYTRYLRKNNPAPFSAFIQFPKSNSPSESSLPPFVLLSSSPERFLKVENGIAEMKPIKGTVARVLNCVCPNVSMDCDFGPICESLQLKEDNIRKQNLWEDVKERAENLMIVDLIRNDLAQVCYPSSVQVPKLMYVETYEKVHHLVSTVRGTLRSKVNAVDALKKCFPPGSMTGAPKLRSVQLLDQLENNKRRGVYSGCLGYLSLDGNADFNVVIRTAIVTKKSNDQVELSVGGGGAITYLSVPEQEWKETLLKTKSVAPSVKQYLEDHY